MDFLRFIVALLPFAMRAYEEAKVSFQRLERLLLTTELTPPSNETVDPQNSVELKSAHFLWEEAVDPTIPSQTLKSREQDKANGFTQRESVNLFGLTDMNLDVKKGELLGICGPVGGGKSSLISALLGRMIHKRGHLAVNGKVAYVAQQAWIFNATVKENILFGLEYDEKRYRQAIACCGLEPDLKLFPDGDETEIGERGANLSGGQKQRVNLARAVYSNSDIYLLDDPLSALDVRVSKEIFHKCIRGQLKGKTIILVTHQLQYLKHCDNIVVMDDGTIVEKGIHEDLMANGVQYKEMMRVFEKTTMKSTSKQSEPGDGEPKTDLPKKPPGVMNGTNGVKPVATDADITKLPEQKEKAKLVLTEGMATGGISFQTYNAYIKSAGGWILSMLVLLLTALASGAQTFSDFWLSIWIDSLPADSQNSPLDNSTLFNVTMSPNTTSLPTSVLANLSTALMTTTTLATTNEGSDTSELYQYIYIGSLVVMLFLTLVSGFALAKATLVAADNLLAACLEKVLKAPMVFFDSNPEGRILNRFSKDTDEVDVFIPQMLTMMLRFVAVFLFSIALAIYVTPWILVGLAPLAIVFYFMKKISAVTIRQLKRLENVTRSPLISHVNVTSQGLPTIVAYGQQAQFVKSCTEYGDVASMTTLLFELSMRWIGVRLDMTAGLVTFAASLIFVLSKGVISPAAAALVLSLCGKNLKIVQFLLRTLNEAEGRFTSVERMYEYSTTIDSEKQTAVKEAREHWPENGAVTFKNVIMKYRPGLDPVLREVSFDILPKEKVGIVGRTGAGKTSLATVLFRLVELTDGNILVDGEDIADLPLNTIRSKISTITQEPVLFAETVRYNVDPFNKYKDDEIWKALEQVHMKEKVNQSDDGLEMMVDESGQNFSVGERQLLCLARALLRSSKILLLDEATANIDTSTDALIQQTIQECFADCTVITIAHRLNTVLHANKIIVLDSGKVMECATPQDLLSDPHSFFNSMIAAQMVKAQSPLPQGI